MTREEAKELLPIIQAFAEGKTIEIYDRTDEEWNTMTFKDPDFDCGPSCYRIKPEPKYRPFKNQEECWNEMLKHQPFGWLKGKMSKNISLIGNIYINKEIWITWATNEKNIYSASDLFNNFTFIDDTPFGIKED